MRAILPRTFALLMTSTILGGCRRADTVHATPALEAHAATADLAKDAAAPPQAPPPAPLPPASVERIRVPGDLVASLVKGTSDAPPVTVFLPGLCSNANAYLQAFPEAARRQGGVVAIEGDQPCGVAGFRSFSWDAGKQHGRIEAALAAAGRSEIPSEGITLVGYSQGAAIAEQLVQRWPARYTRVVLIGAPTDPSAQRLASARGVVTMSCQRDVPARMRAATSALAKVGVPAHYVEMPGCTHGNITDGDRVFDETFDWLRTSSRAPNASSAVVPLLGVVRAEEG